MKTHKYTVAPEDQQDHEIGLEIARVLGLKAKRDNGRFETAHGDKNPCGLARTLRALSDPQHEARAKANAALFKYAELVLSDIHEGKTGWYYQFSAAVEKVRNHFNPAN